MQARLSSPLPVRRLFVVSEVEIHLARAEEVLEQPQLKQGGVPQWSVVWRNVPHASQLPATSCRSAAFVEPRRGWREVKSDPLINPSYSLQTFPANRGKKIACRVMPHGRLLRDIPIPKRLALSSPGHELHGNCLPTGVEKKKPARLPPRRPGFNPLPGHSGFLHVGIVPDDAVGWWVFLGDLPFPPPFHSSTAPYSSESPSSALKASMLRAVQISSLTRGTFRKVGRNRGLTIKWAFHGACLRAHKVTSRVRGSPETTSACSRQAFSTAVPTTHYPLALDGPLMLVVEEGLYLSDAHRALHTEHFHCASLPAEQILQCRLKILGTRKRREKSRAMKRRRSVPLSEVPAGGRHGPSWNLPTLYGRCFHCASLPNSEQGFPVGIFHTDPPRTRPTHSKLCFSTARCPARIPPVTSVKRPLKQTTICKPQRRRAARGGRRAFQRSASCSTTCPRRVNKKTSSRNGVLRARPAKPHPSPVTRYCMHVALARLKFATSHVPIAEMSRAERRRSTTCFSIQAFIGRPKREREREREREIRGMDKGKPMLRGAFCPNLATDLSFPADVKH
ncbi:hypothetical protein PR048_015001 [Dryococelus australis]|uniref:Uncharacterized protein n=1 Tax=Dryococelus australis TaxID=614101 RepID=A0ABQ9HG57_9NEOP|nr:hypothetical protein PR048_015001 [Dryococelus australis]